jgi:hypothetical protein
MDDKNIFSDNFIGEAIIKSQVLLEKYKKILDKIQYEKSEVESPKSDLDPFYIIKVNKIVIRASYIGQIYDVGKSNEYVSNIYIKWAWSDITLNKASKVNLIRIFKYFLEREPNENSPIFTKIYSAFIHSSIKVDEIFFDVLLNALLHLMKHICYIIIDKKIYFIKEILE